MTTADGIAGACVAFLLAVVTTPVGVSGAVLLLPFQASVLKAATPALTPTNLLYNVVTMPGRTRASGSQEQPSAVTAHWATARRRAARDRGWSGGAR